MSVAVVGAGGWGRNHVRNFAALGALSAVCELDEKSRTRAAEMAPGARQLPFEEALEDSSIRGMVIATPAPSHFELAKRALLAGKDLLVEKPLALRFDEAKELVDLADDRAQVLMVGHLLLFHPVIEKLKTLIDDGELGDVLYIVAQRTNLGVVRQDENAWWSLAPHDLSIADHLLSDAPEAVSATGGVFLQPERQVEDVVFATLRYPRGRLAHVHVSWLDPHKERKTTVVGSKKMAVFNDTTPNKLTIYDKGVNMPPRAVSYSQGVSVRTGDILIPAIPMAEPLRKECQAFLNAMESREVPMASGRSALGVVAALEAGHRSLQQNGAEVQIPSFEQ